jgi:ABC-type transport system involved in multi-copper enzyme maturation permease subunit
MKFFAILRDSVREALDAKVIYFLFGLSALVILGVASISFQAEPAEKGLQAILQRLPGAQGGLGVNSPLSYTIENFEQTNDTPHAYKGEYRYDLVVKEKAQPQTPPAGEGEGEGPRPVPPKRPARPGNSFRTMVVMLPLMTASEDELTEEQRELRTRFATVMLGALRGGKPSAKKMAELEEALARQIAAVGPPQLEQFIEKQLAGASSLEVTTVSLKESDGPVFRFNVACKARPDTVRTWPHSLVLGFGALTIPAEVGVGTVVYTIENYLVAGFGAGVAMLLSTIVTAFFIPNMLRKGTVDLLISKPIHRWWLLVSKYIGGLTFMFFVTVVIVVGVWLVLGLRSGLWGTGFLLSIFVLTFQFAIFYAFSALIAVLTRSPIVCILGTVAVWAVLWGLSLALFFMKPFHDFKVIPAWAYNGVDTARKVLPRYKDFDALNADLIADDLLARDSQQRKEIRKSVQQIRWGESLGVTVGYIAALLGLACWRFTVKDY